MNKEIEFTGKNLLEMNEEEFEESLKEFSESHSAKEIIDVFKGYIESEKEYKKFGEMGIEEFKKSVDDFLSLLTPASLMDTIENYMFEEKKRRKR